MAEPRTYHSLCYNSPPGSEDELAKNPPGALTKGSNTCTSFPPISQAQTPADAVAPTPASPRGIYTNVDLQKAINLAIKSFV